MSDRVMNSTTDRLSKNSKRQRRSAQNLISAKDKSKDKFLLLDQTLSETFPVRFKRLCAERNITSIPGLYSIHERKKSNSKSAKSRSDIYVTYYKMEEKTPETIMVRGYQMQDQVFETLFQALSPFPTLTVIKLEYCAITPRHVAIIARALQALTNVNELSLNGNPLANQSFASLLRANHLRALSLTFCDISAAALEPMSVELAVHIHPLIHLNLSSNLINGPAVRHIVHILKINRSLLSLILTDNKMDDDDCQTLMSVFKQIPLEAQEIKLRREQLFNFHKEIIKEKKMLNLEAMKNKKKVKEKEKHTKKVSDRVSSPSTNSAVPKKRIDVSLSLGADNSLTGHTHPLIAECWDQDSQVLCKGNYSLVHLNLAYNCIEVKGLISVLEAVKYQMFKFPDQGLSRLVLVGNKVDPNCGILFKITELLFEKLKRRHSMKERSSSSLKKRKGSGISF